MLWTFTVTTFSITRGHVLSATAIVLAWSIGTLVQAGLEQRSTFFGAGRPVYGLFDVETLASGRATVNASGNDDGAWKIVGSTGRTDRNTLFVQFANGDVRQYRLEDDTVLLSGVIGSEAVKMRLRPVEPTRYPLADWR